MNAIQAVLLAAALIWLIRYLARARVTGLSRLLGLAAALARYIDGWYNPFRPSSGP